MRFMTLFAVLVFGVCSAASSPAFEGTVTFPKIADGELGYVDKLVLTVACGRVSSLHNIPELYNIEMWLKVARGRNGYGAISNSG